MLLYGKCWDGLLSLTDSFQTFAAKTHHATYTSSNHSHWRLIPLITRKIHSNKSFHWTLALRNRRSRDCNLGHDNRNFFKGGQSVIYLTYSHKMHSYVPLTSMQYLHSWTITSRIVHELCIMWKIQQKQIIEFCYHSDNLNEKHAMKIKNIREEKSDLMFKKLMKTISLL